MRLFPWFRRRGSRPTPPSPFPSSPGSSRAPSAASLAPPAPLPERAADLLEAAVDGAALKKAARAVTIEKVRAQGLRVLRSADGQARVAYCAPSFAKGGNYKVYGGVDLHSGEPVAVRRTRGKASSFWTDLAHELQGAGLCGNALHAQDVLLRKRAGKPARTYVTLPMMSTDLFRAVCKAHRLPRRDRQVASLAALQVVPQIAASLARLHAAGWVHRDIKPENLLMGADGRARLADLDAAKPASRVPRHVFGTPAYMAPGVLDGKRRHGLADDVYGLGATLWALAVGGDYPFLHVGTDHDDLRLLQDKLAEGYPLDAELAGAPKVALSLRRVDPRLRSLIIDMMHPEAAQRPTMPEVCARLQQPELQLSPAEQDRARNFLREVLREAHQEAPNLRPAADFARSAWRGQHGDAAAAAKADTLDARLKALGML